GAAGRQQWRATATPPRRRARGAAQSAGLHPRPPGPRRGAARHQSQVVVGEAAAVRHRLMTSALHPELEPEERRLLLLRGVELFNAARFYEAHEVWEEVWRSTTPEPKDLLQGLIQVAVGMVHHRDRGRPAVARRVLAK